MSHKHDYKIIVKEKNELESIQIQLLSRNNREPIIDVDNLNFFNADKLIEKLVKDYNIHMDSIFEDYALNEKGEIINKHVYTVREYLETDS